MSSSIGCVDTNWVGLTCKRTGCIGAVMYGLYLLSSICMYGKCPVSVGICVGICGLTSTGKIISLCPVIFGCFISGCDKDNTNVVLDVGISNVGIWHCVHCSQYFFPPDF